MCLVFHDLFLMKLRYVKWWSQYCRC